MLLSLLVLVCSVLGSLAAVLVDFQVAQPPPLPKDAKQCTVQLFQHTFGASFGEPAIAQFTPSTDCGTPGSWAGISLNFTVTSNGTQFDRLALFTLDGVEIWRSSTPEPTSGDGIIWTYLKDVTRYTPLFAKPGTLIVELDNLLETGLDGQYATTLYVTFFESSAKNPPTPKSDLILSLANLSSNPAQEQVASVPPDFSTTLTFPRNTVEAYAELYASGNGNEEFWYFNVPNEFLGDLPAGFTFGNGAFREVRLLVDGQVAGAAFPYATIFTGGIIPTAWRPITSYGALDLPTYFIDLTPFVPQLADGKPHNLSLSVSSSEANHTINQNWFVTGLVQVVTDSSNRPTTGRITKYEVQPFAQSSMSAHPGTNGDVNITVTASRSVHIEAQVISGSGKVNNVVFAQDLSFSNVQSYLKNLTVQNVVQASSGTVRSTHNGVTSVLDQFSFPLTIDILSLNAAGSEFNATFDHSYDRQILPAPFILGSTINEHQFATGFFNETPSGNFGNGTSNNTLNYVDTKGNTFNRQVDAALNNILLDQQSGTLAPSANSNLPHFPIAKASMSGGVRLPGGRLKITVPAENPGSG